MKPRKKNTKPEPDNSGKLAGWVGAMFATALIALIIYVDQYGR